MNLDFELNYWKKEGIKRGIDHQRKYCLAYMKIFEDLTQFPLAVMHRNATCVEVGPGPFGGMATVLFPKEWIFIDPLNLEYAKLVKQGKKKVSYMNAQVERVTSLDNKIDAVFCTNSLDHTENRQLAEKKIYKMLKKGGLFFLAVHCRTKEQLNEGHSQAFNSLELVTELIRIGFKTINFSVATEKLIPEQRIMYTTFIGVFRK